ncbi:hypothetical protein DB30_06417 [Enhygromyxa salina]|uniref:Thoeris protein ThsB TIR-like domain-containing protein n=2 Tax=Enhygromyxa salina TaxID=215803 RepID=A0A0C2CU62_9BACT|nr:hypothetical protein DB30_06417 [Enhygromyxa salina]
MHMRNVQHVDSSVPVWDQLNVDNPQSEIERRISECDRVLVILTKRSHKSDWINQEVAWARQYGKPVIGIWPHGEAGSPIPREVLEANAHLIGWRATSLEKAVMLEDVGDYRALDLAEDADFDRAVCRVVGAVGAVSLLLIGYELGQAHKLQRALRSRRLEVNLVGDPRSMAQNTVMGAGVGAFLMAVVGLLFGRTRGQVARLAGLGAVAGAGFVAHHHLKVRVRQLETLTIMEFEQANQPKALGPG